MDENNEIIEGKYKLNNKLYPIRFVICSDLVSLHASQGLKTMKAHHKCIYCIANWNEGEHLRDGIPKRDFSQAEGKEHGFAGVPVVPVSCDDIIFDELHCFLRITYVLLMSLVRQIGEKASDKKRLIAEFKRMALNLKFYSDVKGGESATNHTRTEKRKWINLINTTALFPDMPEYAAHWKQTIDLFADLFNRVTYGTEDTSESFLKHQMKRFLHQLLQQFTYADKTYSILKPNEITPYIHIFCFHAVDVYIRHGPLKSENNVKKKNKNSNN